MKILHYNTAVYFALFSIIITSCTPAYIPNRVNTPLLSNSGEIQASVSTGISGFDPQISYAITDHIGVMANGSFADRSNDTTDNFHIHNFFELGGGYYDKLEDVGRYGLYGGFGFGNVETEFDNDIFSKRTDANLLRYFIQPSIGVVTDVFDASFATRVALVNTKIKDSELNNPKGNDLYFEPVLTTRLGYKYVKFLFQVGLSFRVMSSDLKPEYQPVILNLGLQFTLFQDL
jgi:hypothetical protein